MTIRHRTIAERPFGWDFGPNQFFRAQRRKLVKSRPPFSGKHRGLHGGSAASPAPVPSKDAEQPGDTFDELTEELKKQFDPESEEQEEANLGEPDEDGDEEGLTPDEDGDTEIEVETDEDKVEEEEEEEEEKYELPPLPVRTGRHIPFFEEIDDTVVRQFPSWYDFVTCAADPDLQNWTEGSSHRRGNADWSGTDTFDDAVEMALTRGWPAGRELFYDCQAAIPQTKKIFESEIYEVAGPIPIIQIYNTGDPACMMDWNHDRRANNPIVKIDASIARSVNIKIQTIAQRGAALVSLINRLELEGYSVEVNMVDYRRGNSWGNRKDFYCRVAFKAAGEQLDLDRTAMALAHASTFRRFCFAIVEQHDILRSGFHVGMGFPLQTAFSPLTDDQTIFIPSPTHNETLVESRVAVEIAALAFFNRRDINLEAAE